MFLCKLCLMFSRFLKPQEFVNMQPIVTTRLRRHLCPHYTLIYCLEIFQFNYELIVITVRPGSHPSRCNKTRLRLGTSSRSKEGNLGGVSPHHPTRGLGNVVSFPSGSGTEPGRKMDFMDILYQKEAICILKHLCR